MESGGNSLPKRDRDIKHRKGRKRERSNSSRRSLRRKHHNKRRDRSKEGHNSDNNNDSDAYHRKIRHRKRKRRESAQSTSRRERESKSRRMKKGGSSSDSDGKDSENHCSGIGVDVDKKESKLHPHQNSEENVTSEHKVIKNQVNSAKSKSLAPMTREEYEKQQSTVREIFDPESGRHRLIRGTGEIIERIVSRSVHERINKIATAQDGMSFSRNVNSAKHKK